MCLHVAIFKGGLKRMVISYNDTVNAELVVVIISTSFPLLSN